MVTAYVSEVIDGDTFKTSKGNIIRLSGVNASERGTPSRARLDKCYVFLLMFPSFDDEYRFGAGVRDLLTGAAKDPACNASKPPAPYDD